MKRIMIDSNTPVYGILGNPVCHSLSPVMQNIAFSHLRVPGVYLAFKVTDIASAIKGIKALNIKGVSVTIPYKTDVIEFLDEIEETAEKIKAVNTIVNNDGKLSGYNTDCSAAMDALSEKTDVRGKTVGIIGAGGAARAIGFGLVQKQASITIFNRSKHKGKKLADELGGDFLPVSDFHSSACKIVINTTCVGMWPDVGYMPIESDKIHKNMVIMDIVYNPVKTRLLQVAEKKGCKTINGIAMFVRQGALQFEMWTNKKAPVHVMRDAVLKVLSSGQGKKSRDQEIPAFFKAE
jgi:shikimate dehydrogenase